MKFYIIDVGTCISVSKFLGYYCNEDDAKEEAFTKMYDGDVLMGFDDDVDPETIDRWGYHTVDDNMAKYEAKLHMTNRWTNGVPANLWYWVDAWTNIDQVDYYYRDGTLWNGEDVSGEDE